MTENSEKKQLKVLIMGLGNSGKTSILLSLRKNTNLLSYCGLKATKGVKVVELKYDEFNISAWDFGGQKKYREEYLINFKRYSEKADKIIYVIDVQDFNKYGNSLEYLKKIINLLVENKKFIEFSIFLHKYDPNLGNLDEFKEIDEKVKSELINKIPNIIPSEIKIDMFKTSIFTVFQKTSIQLK